LTLWGFDVPAESNAAREIVAATKYDILPILVFTVVGATIPAALKDVNTK
jgi:hypothetical protein